MTLPAGWREVELQSVVEVRDSLREPVNAEARAKRQGPFPYYGANGQAGTIDEYRYEGEHILVAEDGGFFDEPWRGVAYRVTGRFWVNNHAHVLRAGPEVVARFLELQLNTLDWMKYVSGTTRLKLTQASMNRILLRLPPRDTQRSIVAKLDELLAQSRAAREQLEAVPALVEQYRQSVLAAAFRGDLTKDWRVQNPDVEPASKLLERIRAERRRQWETAELAKMKAKGKAPKDDKWKAKYEEPEPVDASELPELPPTWAWASLDELLLSMRNGISAKPDEADGVAILRISAVRPMRVDLADTRFLPHGAPVGGYELEEGDLLFTRYNGNEDLVGSCGVVRGLARPTVYPDKLIRCRVISELVHPDVIAMASCVEPARAFINSKRKSAAGQVGIAGSDLKRLPVPLPPLPEQRALITTALQAYETDLLSPALGSTAALRLLERSLLSKAFRGELDLDGADAQRLVRKEEADQVAEHGRRGRRTA